MLVTGASRGLGLGIARQLVSAGYRVIGVARNDNGQFSEARTQAEAISPGSFIFRGFDLSDIEKIPSFVSQLRKDHGPVYGLVNNAGISFEGALAMMPTDQIERLVRLNTLSPIILTKYVVRSMMSQGEGRIVNLSSIIASTGYKGLSVYGATKSSLVGFSKSLAREVGSLGINVNLVAPGFVDTELTHSLNEESRSKIARRSALNRLTEVQDVASAVEFLLSDQAKNITGTVITVDAGSTA